MIIYKELKNGIEALQKNFDKFDSNSCERTVIEVLKETKVQDAFIKILS